MMVMMIIVMLMLIVMMIVCKHHNNNNNDNDILRECAAEQRTSSWLRARVAKGLRAAPLRQFRRAKSRKLSEFQDQEYP